MPLLDNKIYIGSIANPDYYYDNAQLMSNSAVGDFSVDVISNELSIDELRFTVTPMPIQLVAYDDAELLDSDENNLVIAGTATKDYMQELPFGTPVWWKIGNDTYAKGYLKSVKRVGREQYEIRCVSGVGLLENKIHVGGLYSRVAMTTVLQSIIGSAFTYAVNADVATTLVDGRLPYDTARNNLHRLLFACGAMLLKGGSNGEDYTVSYLSDGVTDIPSYRVAINGSVDYKLPSNKAEITEHSFFQTANDLTKTLYDTQSGVVVDHQTIVFEEPSYNLTGSGLTINESGVNYAIVSGTGTLTGKVYTHTRRIYTISDIQAGEAEQTRRVTENELVSQYNVRNVAQRILSYYKSARTIRAKIMLNDEKCGQIIHTVDPFGEETTGYLTKATVTPDTVKGAQCEITECQINGGNGNYYTNRVLITQSGTWIVPAGKDGIRIVAHGGGEGGQGGAGGEGGCGGLKSYSGDISSRYYTEDGKERAEYYYADGEQRTPSGGAGGNGGRKGKHIIYDVNVSPGETITISIGTGGAGGAGGAGANGAFYHSWTSGNHGGAGTPTSGSQGTDGGATTVSGSFGTITSANGTRDVGYYDADTGTVYGNDGVAGTKGGNGGTTDTSSLRGSNGANGYPGQNVGSNTGGTGGTGKNIGTWSGTTFLSSGGGGGGASVGGIGSNGTSGYRTNYQRSDGRRIMAMSNGGNGANATAPAKATLGNGGAGGNGGGAGGNAGGAYNSRTDLYDVGHDNEWTWDGGDGGNGSAGGAGGDGFVIIYY